MPELPEVETIRRELSSCLPGATFEDVSVLYRGSIKYPAPEEFVRRLTGSKVMEVFRRGKYLLFSLSRRKILVVHLGMTGALLVTEGRETGSKHLRVVMNLDNGNSLLFDDSRKFGGVWLLENGENFHRLDRLGPDWWEEVDREIFRKKIANKNKAQLKLLLLNQQFISGLGNIYADEILYRACLSPFCQAGSLKGEEIDRLYRSVKETLRDGILCGGTSTRDYKNARGKPGKFQEELLVYQKEGERCIRCGETIKRASLSGRGTYFCPVCQGIRKSRDITM